MRSASAEHLPEATSLTIALAAGGSPLRAAVVILLAWAIVSTLVVGGIGAWVAMWRSWRTR
jgi:hypothetical protein